MFIHLERITGDVLIGRGYTQPDGWVRRAPFSLVFTVHLLGPDKVKLAGMLARDGSELSLASVRAIAQALHKEFGISHIELVRHGRACTWPLLKWLKPETN